jgi:hypothetical protein
VTYKISNTQIDCYNQCSELYRLRYREGWKTKVQPSALWFGSALDEAFEMFLLTKKEELTESELDRMLTTTAYDTYVRKMKETWDNHWEYLDFFASDFDPLVFKTEDLKTLKTKFPHIPDFLQFFEDNKKNRDLKDDKEAYNYLVWLSLFRKGEMLLDAYEKEILPNIHKVYSIQREVELLNESGDILGGKIDYEASFTDDPDIIYVCDNKTSSQPYPEDSVINSQQLSIYTEAVGTNKAAYTVVEKKIRKTEPKTRTQIIKSTIPEETYEKVFTNIENTLTMIHNDVFEKKALSKECWFFGKPCSMYGLCWNGDVSMLYKKEKV